MKQSIIHGDVSFVGIIRYKHFNCYGCDREEGLESTMAQTDLNTNFCVDSIHKLPVITFLMTKFQILTRKCKGVQTLILQMLPNLTCCKLKIVKQLFKNKQRPNCEAKPGARVCSTETPKKPVTHIRRDQALEQHWWCWCGPCKFVQLRRLRRNFNQ